MGISGLLPFIKNSCRPSNVNDFKGCSVAIDAYGWLHKGAFSCAEKIVKGEKTDGYIHFCMKRINLLLSAGLKPVMVFDGCNLESKAGTEKKRHENRERMRQRGKEFLCQGKIREATECFQRCVDITPEMAAEVIMACKAKGVDCIVAPYEADAQIAYLNRTNVVQLVITEDSDLVVFGCTKILFKMDGGGGGLLYEKESLPKSFGMRAEKMSFEKFRYMCILSGCDYLPSLPGIGLVKACKFVTVTNNPDIIDVLPKLPSYSKMPKLAVTKEYKDSFVRANNTFLYQLVFCPKKKELLPLNPYPEDMDWADMEYAGKYFSPDVAIEMAMGNINVKTMTRFNISQFSQSQDAKVTKRSIWSDNSFEDQPCTKTAVSGFKFKKRSDCLSSPPKKRSRHASEKDENVDVGMEDELLFLAYGAQESSAKVTKVPETPEKEIGKQTENLTSSNPFRKVLSPTTSPNVPLPNPFRRIVKSRFFTDSSNADKPKKSLLDAIEDEYRISPQPVSSINQQTSSKNEAVSVGSDMQPTQQIDDEAVNSSAMEVEDDDVLSFDFEDFECTVLDSKISSSAECNSFQESFNCSSTTAFGCQTPIISQDSEHLKSSPELENKGFDDEVIDISESPKKVNATLTVSPYFNTDASCVDDPAILSSRYRGNSDKKSAKSVSKRKSIGMSRNRFKSEKQMAVNDTLFNFNFTRHINL